MAITADGYTVIASSPGAASEHPPHFLFQLSYQLSHRRVRGSCSPSCRSLFFRRLSHCPRRSATFPRLVSMPHGPLSLCLALDAASHVFNLTFHLVFIHDSSSWICVWISSKRPVPACFRAERSLNSEYWASALDQADQNCDHCQNQENMNESTQRVRADHT